MRLEVKDLRYGYTQAREVVKGVSFTAQAGECLAVLGVNGVGKTTMLKCINRIIRPSSGEVLVDGVPVGKLGGRALAQQAPVLLFDEPTSNLDIKNQLDVLDITRQVVRRQNLAAVVIIHDLNLALRFADKFLVMKDGAVFAFGGKAVVNAETIRQVYGVHAQVVEYDGRPVVIPQ